MRRGNVETTWIFTQSIFMAINTLLWTLSYEEVRKRHPREEVKSYLDVGLESIMLASERWPGAASAHDLYVSLIDAVLQIYEKDGDIHVTGASAATSPESIRPQSTNLFPTAMLAEGISPLARPAAASIPEPEMVDPLEKIPEPTASPSNSQSASQAAPFGYISEDFNNPIRNSNASPSSPLNLNTTPITPPGLSQVPKPAPPTSFAAQTSTGVQPPMPNAAQEALHASRAPRLNMPPTPSSPRVSQKAMSSRTTSQSPGAYENLHYFHPQALPPPPPSVLPYDPSSSFNQLPTTFGELANWSPNFVLPTISANLYPPSATTPFPSSADADPSLASTSPFEGAVPYTEGYDPRAGPPSGVPQQQQQQQFQDYYPDPYWIPEMLTQGVGGGFTGGATAMMGNGLAVEQQAGLMQSLESVGQLEIEKMIQESQAFLDGRRPGG